jgi:RNA polymerase sigma-70 factor (sigma-E family)
VDRDAEDDFRAFVHGAYRRLLRTGYLLTGDPHRAEDLAQETLAKVALAWHRISRADAVDAYVRRVMVNTCTSLWRRRRWRERPTGEPPDRPGPDPYAGSDERDRLRRALTALPARQRAAVVLRHYEDLTEGQAATALGCSVGTVKSLTSRGLARLRTELTGGGSGDPPRELAGVGSRVDLSSTRAPAAAHHGKGQDRA